MAKKKLLTHEEYEVKVTLKGRALLLMMESGLCPPTLTNESYKAFEKFWNGFEAELLKEEERKSIEKKSNQSRDKRTKDGDFEVPPIVLACLVGFLVGSLIFALVRIIGIL